jgi:hypothetical protein
MVSSQSIFYERALTQLLKETATRTNARYLGGTEQICMTKLVTMMARTSTATADTGRNHNVVSSCGVSDAAIFVRIMHGSRHHEMTRFTSGIVVSGVRRWKRPIALPSAITASCSLRRSDVTQIRRLHQGTVLTVCATLLAGTSTISTSMALLTVCVGRDT